MQKSSIEIFFGMDTELSEWEAINKGCRSDVYVLYNGVLFKVNVYTPVRLVQDFNTELKEYGFYSVDENIVMSKSTDKNTIVELILKLQGEGYFDKIKPLSNNETGLLVKVYWN